MGAFGYFYLCYKHATPLESWTQSRNGVNRATVYRNLLHCFNGANGVSCFKSNSLGLLT
jgi:hypothetical protein